MFCPEKKPYNQCKYHWAPHCWIFGQMPDNNFIIGQTICELQLKTGVFTQKKHWFFSEVQLMSNTWEDSGGKEFWKRVFIFFAFVLMWLCSVHLSTIKYLKYVTKYISTFLSNINSIHKILHVQMFPNFQCTN